jgi:hypothetical protein
MKSFFSLRSLFLSKQKFSALFLCIFYVSISQAQTIKTEEPHDWPAIARKDLQFAAKIIGTRHPGVVLGRASVVVPLEEGMRTALAQAELVRSQADYQRLMQRFGSGFGDPHVGVSFKLPAGSWTGIVIDHVLGEYRVIWSEPVWPVDLPPVGARVKSCDDIWIGTYLQNRVAAMRPQGAEYSLTFSGLARNMMFDQGQNWSPKHCVFRAPDGAERDYVMHPQSVPADISPERIAEVKAQYQAKATPVGISTLAPDQRWIGMPRFFGEALKPAYEKLYQALESEQKAGWIIFDLRGNGGGNSSWGNRALEALYGKPYAKKLAGTVSRAKFMTVNQEIIDEYIQSSKQPELASSKLFFEKNAQLMQVALQAGEKLVNVSDKPPTLTDYKKSIDEAKQRPAGPRIAAVIDRSCFSSCMNFLLQIKAMGDTVVLGESTIGWSPYGENGAVEFPSGLGSISVPVAWYDSQHAEREPFVPDLIYTGSMAENSALMQWVSRTLTALPASQK